MLQGDPGEADAGRIAAGDIPAFLAFIEENGVEMLGLLRFHCLAFPLRASIAVLLAAGPALAVAEAPRAQSGTACTAEQLLLEAGDGTLLHAQSYRPDHPATRGVILAAEGLRSAESCWGTLPEELCALGFEVLLPDLEESQDAAEPNPTSAEDIRRGMALWLESALLGGAFGDSVATVGLLALGSAGWAARQLIAEETRVRALVWLSPRANAAAETAWQLPSGAAVRLLLVAAENEIESSVLAGDLFSRFNETAELRLISRVDGGCGLLTRKSMRDALLVWLQGACAAPAAVDAR